MKKQILLVLFNLILFDAQANCPRDCNEITKVRDICITNKGLWEENFAFRQAIRTNCAFKEIIVVNSKEDVIAFFDSISNNCQSIRKLSFIGHGNSGTIVALFASYNNVNSTYSGYQCLFEKGAEIELDGCNTGTRCRGQAFTYEVAKTFLSTSGGTVWANNAISTGLGITPHVSIDFTIRRTTFRPAGDQIIAGTELRGVMEAFEEDEACGPEYIEVMNEYEQATKEVSNHCRILHGIMTGKERPYYRPYDWFIQNKPFDIVDMDNELNMAFVATKIDNLRYRTKMMYKCQEELEGSLVDNVLDYVGLGQ